MAVTAATTTAFLEEPQIATEEPYDLVCVGFGPASLAIAIALHDRGIQGKVKFLERQREFRWHGGMLLPDARMQISFLKDLATLRDPTSKFTFLNYLKSKNRLVAFTNLSTFLPLRVEYNDYLDWCASHFEEDVQYRAEAVSIHPAQGRSGTVTSWRIRSRDIVTNKESSITARHVVIAVGGKPSIPAALADLATEPRIVHSSAFATAASRVKDAKSIAVIGGGQSGAEIFNNLIGRSLGAKVNLYAGAKTLKPSDDSPFVNEIFDPSRVDQFYEMPTAAQEASLRDNRATNYGVVRPELLDRLYEMMYHQRLHEPDETKWPNRIVPFREICGYEQQPSGQLRLQLRNTQSGEITMSDEAFDLVVLATGYVRNAHETLLSPTRHLLESGRYDVSRAYQVKYRSNEVSPDCGVWLQGCCEESHGLSDTLLSILAVRGAEIVNSVFPDHGQADVQAKL